MKATSSITSRQPQLFQRIRDAQRAQDAANPQAAQQRGAETQYLMKEHGINANQASILQQQMASQRAMFSPVQAPSYGSQPTQSYGAQPNAAYGSQPTSPYQPAQTSALQNQFALKYMFSLMQAMMALQGGFGSFLGGGVGGTRF